MGGRGAGTGTTNAVNAIVDMMVMDGVMPRQVTRTEAENILERTAQRIMEEQGVNKGEALRQIREKTEQQVAQAQERQATQTKNKFEHLMTDTNRADMDAKGKTTITQYSQAWRREQKVATVEQMVTARVHYADYKRMIQDPNFKHQMSLTKGQYDANTKTIEVTGLKPILKQAKNAKVLKEWYIYGV